MNRDWPGPALIKNVEIIGFDYGVQMLNHWQYSMTFEGLTLRNQRKAGFQNQKNAAFIRALDSVNSVPALEGMEEAGFVIIDSKFTGGDRNAAAIVGKGSLFARNLQSQGYGAIIEWEGTGKGGHKHRIEKQRVEEFVSHDPVSLTSKAAGSLNLPVRETPTFHDNNLDNWVKVDGHDADAIQRAIDATIGTDKTTVYLPNLSASKPAHYTYDKTIVIRGNVRKIISSGAELKPVKGFDPMQPVFRIENGPGSVVVEHFRSLVGRIEQNSTRDFALRFTLNNVAGGYNDPAAEFTVHNTKAGTGAMFLEDVNAEPSVFPGGTLYGRQVNCEFGGDPILENHGGAMWILGFKDEVGKPPITVLHNRKGAKTEILGFFHYVLGRPQDDSQGDTPAVINEGGALSIFYSFNGQRNRIVMQESGGGQVQTLERQGLPQRIPLYISQ